MTTPEEKRDNRILVFDDKPSSLTGLGKTFWDAGWDIAFAMDFKSLQKKLKILSFDLILVNTEVAGFDADVLSEFLSSVHGVEQPPVIAIIPVGKDFSPGEWLEKGLADYIRGKDGNESWDYMEIQARVANHLQFRKELLEYRNQIARLENSNKDKDNFYRILSHDLKAPFQGLVGLLEVLHGEYDTLEKEEVQEYIRNIHDSTKRTYRLLENLMEWSGVQGGQMKWTPDEMDFSLIVQDVLDMFTIGARDKGITISSEVEPGMTVFADRRMLSSVIRNFVYNGIKFTDKGGSIKVKAKESVDYYEISVDDTGVGIHPDNLRKLLRRGETDTTPGTAQESGSGLGLKICRQYIEMNGGQMWVRSEPGRGSSFLFSLPKRKVDLSIIGEASLQSIGRPQNDGVSR
ncbi:MAG: hypothetical protein JEY99_17015 [Spirochaetales bacterium]|nr:hypothetical protein [Spirochaetales bacterium]